MNIIYFTTAQNTAVFNEYLKLWKSPINLSNQTFHNKLIRSIAISNHVDVVSIRPFSKKNCSSKSLEEKDMVEDNIHWHYPKIGKHPFTNVNRAKSYIKSLSKSLPSNAVIITDTINPTVLYLSTYYAKKYHLPIIGVCTDSPSNISGTNRAYTLLLLKLGRTLDGYIALTSGLNELFNEDDKPCLILEGLVEDKSPEKKKNEYGKYIFYSGALSERYGIYSFINFFNKCIKGDIKLVICGHHNDDERMNKEIEKDPRIIYLGNVTNNEALELEASSWCNINPRPFSEDLDRFSIPSKVLEYLNSGAPTISVKNTKIQKYFNPYAIWMKSNNEQDYVEAFQKLQTLNSVDLKNMAKNAKENVQKYYSLTSVNTKLDGFLYLFTSKNL